MWYGIFPVKEIVKHPELANTSLTVLYSNMVPKSSVHTCYKCFQSFCISGVPGNVGRGVKLGPIRNRKKGGASRGEI